MKPLYRRAASIALASNYALLSSPAAWSQQTLFTGLTYDETELQDAIGRYSSRIETTAATGGIPDSVAYRIFIQGLLGDANQSFELSEEDLSVLQDFVSTSTYALAEKQRIQLADICQRAAHAENSPDEIQELAALFEASRDDTGTGLDLAFAEALDRLTPENALAVRQKWEQFRNDKKIVHLTFNLIGFAQEMPDAAQRVMLGGCARFQRMTGPR